VALNWILVIGGALLVLVEVILGAITGFDLVLIGSALMLGGILGLLTKSAALGAATAGVLALLYVGIGRRRIRSRLGRPGIPSNIDALQGKLVRVVETITPERAGRVKHEGDEWRAILENPDAGAIEAGNMVRVNRIDGVTVVVGPAAGAAGGAQS
jgi:membrane protein implicated in regulation of membrane protease activity